MPSTHEYKPNSMGADHCTVCGFPRSHPTHVLPLTPPKLRP